MNYPAHNPDKARKAVPEERGKWVYMYLWSERPVIRWQYIAVPISSPISWHKHLLFKKWSRLRAPLHFLGEALDIEFFWGAVNKLWLYISRSSNRPHLLLISTVRRWEHWMIRLMHTGLVWPENSSIWGQEVQLHNTHRSCPSYLILLLNVHPMMPHVHLTFREVVPLIELSNLGRAHTHKSSGE